VSGSNARFVTTDRAFVLDPRLEKRMANAAVESAATGLPIARRHVPVRKNNSRSECMYSDSNAMIATKISTSAGGTRIA
jgi:hypothetical protein